MKTVAYILIGYLVLQTLTKRTVPAAVNGVPTTAGSASSSALSLLGGFLSNVGSLPIGTQTQTASGIGLTSTGNTFNGQNVFVDDSGDLVTINSTGGETALPDPNGIGGGFAT